MRWKDATSPGDFPAFSNGIIILTLQTCGQWAREKDDLNIYSNSWRPNDLVTWEMKVECCQGQLLLCTSSFWWQITHLKWSTAFIVGRLYVEVFFELTSLWHVKFADPGIVLYEKVGFEFDVSGGTIIVEHCFVWWVGIWSPIQNFILWKWYTFKMAAG